jgi:hypothetical protein
LETCPTLLPQNEPSQTLLPHLARNLLPHCVSAAYEALNPSLCTHFLEYVPDHVNADPGTLALQVSNAETGCRAGNCIKNKILLLARRDADPPGSRGPLQHLHAAGFFE